MVKLHTYTLISKYEGKMIITNHLQWKEAIARAQQGDTILTIKDNHVTAYRKVTVREIPSADDEVYIDKETEHLEGSVFPPYDM